MQWWTLLAVLVLWSLVALPAAVMMGRMLSGRAGDRARPVGARPEADLPISI